MGLPGADVSEAMQTSFAVQQANQQTHERAAERKERKGEREEDRQFRLLNAALSIEDLNLRRQAFEEGKKDKRTDYVKVPNAAGGFDYAVLNMEDGSIIKSLGPAPTETKQGDLTYRTGLAGEQFGEKYKGKSVSAAFNAQGEPVKVFEEAPAAAKTPETSASELAGLRLSALTYLAGKGLVTESQALQTLSDPSATLGKLKPGSPARTEIERFNQAFLQAQAVTQGKSLFEPAVQAAFFQALDQAYNEGGVTSGATGDDWIGSIYSQVNPTKTNDEVTK